ncbi:hypothetical protein EBZ80_23855, partial [bacterium]|nr:hypothetical protein [bacterium]
TRAYSFARAAAPSTYADWAAQYGLAAGSGSENADFNNGNGDFLTNNDEFTANTDPLNADTDGDGLFDDEEVLASYATHTYFNGNTLNPLTSDTDGDGLRDNWELQYRLDPKDNGTVVSYVNNTGLAVVSNPNGADADPDADGLTNAQEQAAGTNPLAGGTGFAFAHPKITVPGTFSNWDAAGSLANTMQLFGNFSWRLIVYFASAPSNPAFKFAAGGWATSWGDTNPANGIADLGSPTNISAANTFILPGYYKITFNDLTLAYTLSPLSAVDLDSDGLPDEWEDYYGGYLTPPMTNLNPATAYVAGSSTTAAQAYAAGIDPVRDTVPPTISLAPGIPVLTWVALGGAAPNVSAADVVVSDDVATGLTPQITVRKLTGTSPGVVAFSSSESSTWQIEYLVTDNGGNQAILQRVIVVGDEPPGWRAMNWPPTMTLSTIGSGPVYGQIFVDGATAAAGAAPGIQAWVGVNAANTDPATWDASAWTAASFNSQSNANDEYVGTISGSSLTPGTYYYAYRWQIGSAAYFYGGIKSDGSGSGPWDGTTNGNGVLTVNAAVLRDVTFAVDMGVQIFKGAFDPATNGVEVRATFNNFAGGASTLSRVGTSTLYSGTFQVEGAEGATNNYKFFMSGTNATGYEASSDRQALLTAHSVPLNTGTNFFSNLTESRKITFRVDMSIQQQLGNFNSSTGTVKVAGTFNNWTATDLTAQGNGIYAGEFLVDGPLSVVEYKFISGTTYESLGNRTLSVALNNLAASTLNPVYFNDVSVAGSTFAGWSGGATLDATNVGKYAIGGASSLSATDGVKPALTVSGGNLVLTAIVRVDDPKLSVFGEVVTNLANYGTPASTTMIDGATVDCNEKIGDRGG